MDKKELSKRQERLAGRFKDERIRLGLARRAVATICGVTETTVVNWEHGGAKIPLVALELLIPHGFSTRNLVAVPEARAAIREIGPDGKVAGWVSVNAYMLERYSVSRERAFLFHATEADCLPVYILGSTGLFRFLIDDAEILADASGLMLLKRRRGMKAFLCEIEPGGKAGLRLRAGGARKSMSPEKLHQACMPLGMYLGPADQLPRGPGLDRRKRSLHEEELRKLGE